MELHVALTDPKVTPQAGTQDGEGPEAVKVLHGAVKVTE